MLYEMRRLEKIMIKSIAIVPTSSYFESNKLFNLKFNRDNLLSSYIQLKDHFRNQGILVNTIDMYKKIKEVDVFIFERIDFEYIEMSIRLNPNAMRILIPWEPEVVIPSHSKIFLRSIAKYFDYILTWNDDLIDDNIKFHKIFLAHHLSMPSNDFEDQKNFSLRKMLVQISSNLKSNHQFELYSLRKMLNSSAYLYFDRQFDFYGRGWPIKQNSYRGVVASKELVIRNYRFALCFENMSNVKGYITEKIFDCFSAGVVPIYYGATNISDYIPNSTFIDYRLFNKPEDLFIFIENIDYEEWREYLINGRNFLKSQESAVFSIENYVKVMSEVVFSSRTETDFNLYDLLYLKSKVLKSKFRKFMSDVKKQLSRS
jgi:alpha(1,3/1,4) fucosyltransferase